MRPSCLALGGILLAAASPGFSQSQTTELETVHGIPNVDRTTQTEDIRFKNDQNDRMTVPVRVSGTGPFRFLVDTGADRTAVSRQLATRLNMPAGQVAELHSIAGASTISTATIPTLQLTSKEIRNINAPLLEGENMGADGILGADALRSQRILFDFKSNTLSIVPSVVPEIKDDPNSIVIRGSRLNGRLVITRAMANDTPVVVVIDTGSQVTIGNRALRRALSRSHDLSGSHPVEIESVTGEKITGDYTFVHDLVVGGVTLKDLAIVFTDAHTFDQLKLNKMPAVLLGMNAMRAFKKVSIDFANKKLRVVLPEESMLDVKFASARD
jgi:predicted aspartyl protease